MFDAVHFVRSTTPRVALFENVQGMLVATGSRGEGKSPKDLLMAEMLTSGYHGVIIKMDLQLFQRVTRQRTMQAVIMEQLRTEAT